MSRQMQIVGTFGMVFSLALGTGEASAQCPTPPSGFDCKCNGDDTRWVCATWSETEPPEENSDFTVTYTGNIPAVKFATGDLGWELYSEKLDVNGDPDGPAHLGAITLHPTVNGDDFTLKIAKGTGIGAVNVGSMVLDGAANPNWTGFSSIVGFSRISGDLGGLTLVKDSSGNGGKLSWLLVSGDLTAALTVPIVTGFASSFGSVIGDADVTIGKVDASSISFVGSLVCVDAVCPDITVTDKIFDGKLKVSGNVPSGSTVKIEELEEASPPTGITLVSVSTSGDFVGTLDLPNGLANAHTKIQMGGEFSGVMNLGFGAVAKDAEIAVYFSTPDAVIKNVGAVSGDIYLVLNIPGQTYTYAGTVTVDSVTSTGEIATTSIDPSIDADFAGTLNVKGNMAGLIEIIGEHRLGAVIKITGDLTGDVDIEGALKGSLTVLGALDNSGLTGGGRILVDGLMDGPIKIHDETDTLTLIHLLAGLDDNGSIEINVDRGNYSAGGDIQIGPTSQPADVVFDGCIHIYDNNEVVANHGDLDGDITIVGCHATGADLDICVDGDVNGTVTITQTDCTNQVDWSCPQVQCP